MRKMTKQEINRIYKAIDEFTGTLSNDQYDEFLEQVADYVYNTNMRGDLDEIAHKIGIDVPDFIIWFYNE